MAETIGSGVGEGGYTEGLSLYPGGGGGGSVDKTPQLVLLSIKSTKGIISLPT